MSAAGRTVALVTALTLAAQGCGGEAAETPRSPRLVDPSAPPPYVNALDRDPADGSLLLTTNTGFWRIDPEEDRVERVRGTLTAGGASSSVGAFLELEFTGPGTLLGSGHPDDPDALPESLGLIASDDAGRSWRVISRLGEADLHKIVLAHDRMYAFDAVLGAMLVSDDGGRSFTEQFAPRGQIIDFDVDPDDPDRIVASTDEQLFRTADGGRSWRGLEPAEGARLAWPAPGALYRAERDGTVRRSGDGTRWERVGSVPGEPYKFEALGPEELLLALGDGTIVRTEDGGRTWTEEFRP